MSRRPLVQHLAGAAVLVLGLAGCSSPAAPTRESARSSDVATDPADVPGATVRTRVLDLFDPSRDVDPTPADPGTDATSGRPLPTTLWYPSDGSALPVVVFTHGLGAEPDNYEDLLIPWATAGFVVVAPRYPLTSAGTEEVFEDVRSQPADVAFVLDEVLALDDAAGDELEDRIDTEHVAASGHSAGAITTLGLLDDCCADDRIDAAVLLAGSPLFFGGQVDASDVPALFVHPTEDAVLPIEEARAVFESAPAPAAFLELVGGTHTDPFAYDQDPAFPAVTAATTAFLRWALTDDDQALQELRAVPDQWPDAVLAADRLPRG